MEYKTFQKYFMNVAAALYQPYKFSMYRVNAIKRSYYVTITNPVKQHLYVTGEMYSSRHFPRNCNPKNNAVLYFKDSANKQVGERYSFIGRQGFGTVGEMVHEVPAGKYTLIVVNQGYSSGPADITLSVYATRQSPTVVIPS